MRGPIIRQNSPSASRSLPPAILVTSSVGPSSITTSIHSQCVTFRQVVTHPFRLRIQIRHSQQKSTRERVHMSVQDSIATPAINLKGDAAFRFLGLPTQVRASAETTNGAFGLAEHWEMPPGFASPYHTHHREDESFYILQGQIAFVIDGKWQRVGPGGFVFGPREIPHGFKVVGDEPAQMLLQATPGGFEQFVIELGQPLTDPIAPPDIP